MAQAELRQPVDIGAVMASNASAVTSEHGPYQDPEWVWMDSKPEGTAQGRRIIERALGAYGFMRRLEQVERWVNHTYFIGSRERRGQHSDWNAIEQAFALERTESPKRSLFAFRSRSFTALHDGRQVFVHADSLKAYRHERATSDQAAAVMQRLSGGLLSLPFGIRLFEASRQSGDAALAALHIAEVVGVMPEVRDGVAGTWVVWTRLHETRRGTVREHVRGWFDDQSGLLRRAEFDVSARDAWDDWSELDKWCRRGPTDTDRRTFWILTFKDVRIDAPERPALLHWRPSPLDRLVEEFAWPQTCGGGDDEDRPPMLGPWEREKPERLAFINRPAPAFRYRTTENELITNESLRGRPAVFFFDSCGADDLRTRDTPEQIEALRKRFEHDGLAVIIIGISREAGGGESGTSEELRGRFSGKMVLDGRDMIKRFWGEGTRPVAAFIDAEGIIRDVRTGMTSGLRDEDLESRAERLVAGTLKFTDEEIAGKITASKAYSEYWDRGQHGSDDRATRPEEMFHAPAPNLALITQPEFGSKLGEDLPRRIEPWRDLEGDGKPDTWVRGPGADAVHVNFSRAGPRTIRLQAPMFNPFLESVTPIRAAQGTAWFATYSDSDVPAARSGFLSRQHAAGLFDDTGALLWTLQYPQPIRSLLPGECNELELVISAFDVNCDGLDEIAIVGMHRVWRVSLARDGGYSSTEAGSFLLLADRTGELLSFTPMSPVYHVTLSVDPEQPGTLNIRGLENDATVSFPNLGKPE
ncbi:MAG: hypothetical protein ACKVZJ_09715 [Phycisphaerales bacterium]